MFCSDVNVVYVMLSCIPCSQGISPSRTPVVDNLMVKALNFDVKFELDCTRCLWNNYHSVQALITLLDLIFMIMMKWSEKNVCEEN